MPHGNILTVPDNVAMSIPNYNFRIADEGDFDGIEKLFANREVRRGWATWKYRRNPDGHAQVFIAEGPDTSIVGTLVHMPRRFTSSAIGTLSVMQVVDIFMSENLRQQGVFLGLLGFARKHVGGPRIGVPTDASEAFGPGLGWRVLGPYKTWGFPVRVGGLLTGGSLAFTAPLLNMFSRIYSFLWLGGVAGNLEMRPVTRFQTDYELDPQVIHGVRSADYLNWRFVDNPEGTYDAYEFFDGDESIGYCVVTVVGSSVILSDLVTARYRRRCFRLLIDHCQEMGIASISMSGAGLELKSLGFVPHWLSRNCTSCEAPIGQWIITPCDIDFEPARRLRRAHQTG